MYNKIISRKKLVLWSLMFLVFCLIVSISADTSSSKNTSSTVKKVTTQITPDIKAIKEQQAEGAYIASESAILKQLFIKDSIIQKDFSNLNLSNEQRVADAQDLYNYYESIDFYKRAMTSVPDKYTNYAGYIDTEGEVADEALQDYYLSLEHDDADNADHAKEIYLGAISNLHTPLKHFIDEDPNEIQIEDQMGIGQVDDLMQIPYDENNNPPSW